MIANARMYGVTPAVAALWRQLLEAVVRKSGLAIEVVDHPPPLPVAALWERDDKAAVFMCGLPYSRTSLRPVLVAAPVPSHDEATYWTDMIVAAEAPFRRIEETFGRRIAFTTPESQSGFAAPLDYLRQFSGPSPLYDELVAPAVTPLGAVQMVIDGEAEVAALDSYAHALLRRHAPGLAARLRTVATTKSTPIPPLVASSHAAEPLAAAFAEAHRDPETAPLLVELLLERFARPAPEIYDGLRRDYEGSLRFWREHRFARLTHPAFAELRVEPVGSQEGP